MTLNIPFEQARRMAMDYKKHPLSFLEHKYNLKQHAIRQRIDNYYYKRINQVRQLKRKVVKINKKNIANKKYPYKKIGYGVILYEGQYLYKICHLEEYFKIKKNGIRRYIKNSNVKYYKFNNSGNYHISANTIMSWRRKALNPIKVTRVR